MADAPLIDAPDDGRVFSATRPVRVGDVNAVGRLRFDSLAQYAQDIAGDDTVDGGVGGDLVWIVRRATFEVERGPRFGEQLALRTWCSGIGRRWAERRVSMTTTAASDEATGRVPARVEGALLWVALDRETHRPVAIPDDYLDLVAGAARGRHVSARLTHASLPPTDAVAARRAWMVRTTDYDVLQHVNNAATWAMVEEVIGDLDRDARLRAEIEYRVPIERGAQVELVWIEHAPGDIDLWAVGHPAGASDEVVFATARVRRRA